MACLSLLLPFQFFPLLFFSRNAGELRRVGSTRFTYLQAVYFFFCASFTPPPLLLSNCTSVCVHFCLLLRCLLARLRLCMRRLLLRRLPELLLLIFFCLCSALFCFRFSLYVNSFLAAEITGKLVFLRSAHLSVVILLSHVRHPPWTCKLAAACSRSQQTCVLSRAGHAPGLGCATHFSF